MRPVRPVFGRDEGYVATSPHLAAGPLHRGHRTAIPRREALILQAALNHPWLMHDRLEELAETEFRHADAKRLKAALIDGLAHQFGHDAANREDRARTATKTPARSAITSTRNRPLELVAELTRRGFADSWAASSGASPRLRYGARGRTPPRAMFC